jgi:hypothetical protein
MSLHTGEQTTEELTWIPRSPNGEIDTETELRGNDNGKCTAKQPVPPGHGIYPKMHLISTWIRLDPERMTRP